MTYFDDQEHSLIKLKHNIGVLHDYFNDQAYIIVISKNETFLLDTINYWKNVHLMSIKNMFLKDYFDPESTKHFNVRMGFLYYVFKSFYSLTNTKYFYFENDFLLNHLNPNIISLINQDSSFSYYHVVLNRKILFDFDIQRNLVEIKKILKETNIYIDNNIPSINFECAVKLKDLHLSSLFLKPLNASLKRNGFGILIPTKQPSMNLNSSAFFNVTLPSLRATISDAELKKYNITIYFGIDKTDILFKSPAFLNLHKNKILKTFNNSDFVKIKYLFYAKSESVVFLWNALFVEAYTDMNEYFLQLNDDTKIYKSGWLERSVEIFAKGFDGIIGFNALEWNCKIFTQTIVSAKHFTNNNGDFYHSIFHNAMSDIWLTEFYSDNRICLEDVRTNNHFSKTRYKKCPFNRILLNNLLKNFNKEY